MLLEIFLSFFKVGAFTFGGGYAMLPIIQREVVDRRKWISDDEFLEVLGVSQSGPGAVAVNTAIYLGFRIRGILGSIAATLGVVMPSFLIILSIVTLFRPFIDSHAGQAFFSGVRPAVVGLLISVTIKLFKKVDGLHGYILFALSAILLVFFSVHPAIIILSSALYGAFFITKEIKAKELKAKEGN